VAKGFSLRVETGVRGQQPGEAVPYREEVVTRFAAILLFALFASNLFGIAVRETPLRMFRFGTYCIVLFADSAIALSRLMFVILRKASELR